MADQDTDRYIFEVLAPDLRRKMKTLKDEVQWTDLVYVCQILISSEDSPAPAHNPYENSTREVVPENRLKIPSGLCPL
jgi:hypothetical protein